MRKFLTLSIVVAVGLALLGCANVPQRYTAPAGIATAELNDASAGESDGARPALFVVDTIDGVKIANALNNATRVGSGFHVGMAPYLIARPVQAATVRLHIIGVHVFRGPGEEMLASALGRYRKVEGDLELTLSPNKVYQVAGRLDVDPATIWIEDWETKERVSEVIVGR